MYVLGPLFLIYINDFFKDVIIDEFIFADDTSLFKYINNNIQQAMTTVNKDLDTRHTWSKTWLVTVNPSINVFMLFSSKMFPFLVPPMYYISY